MGSKTQLFKLYFFINFIRHIKKKGIFNNINIIVKKIINIA